MSRHHFQILLNLFIPFLLCGICFIWVFIIAVLNYFQYSKVDLILLTFQTFKIHLIYLFLEVSCFKIKCGCDDPPRKLSTYVYDFIAQWSQPPNSWTTISSCITFWMPVKNKSMFSSVLVLPMAIYSKSAIYHIKKLCCDLNV